MTSPINNKPLSATQYIEGLKCEFGEDAVKTTQAWLKSQQDPLFQHFLDRIKYAREHNSPLSSEDASYLRNCVVQQTSPSSSPNSISSEGGSFQSISPTTKNSSLVDTTMITTVRNQLLATNRNFSIDVIRKTLLWIECYANLDSKEPKVTDQTPKATYTRLQKCLHTGEPLAPAVLNSLAATARSVDPNQPDEYYKGEI